VFIEQIALYDWEREEISISYYKDILNNNKIKNLADISEIRPIERQSG
jgi:hypothetical protein